jgi:hypothetical protein
MGDKYIKAVANYERCRQEVMMVDQWRKSVIAKCWRFQKNGGIVYLKDGSSELAKSCLQECYRNREVDGVFQGKDGFLELITNYYDDDECCESCVMSYEIKIGRLAEAKKQFGIAKRVLSALGKSALK